MSSILKALKRLEEEKANRLDAPVDIARDILRQPHRRSRSIPWLVLAITGCGIAVAAGVLFVWYGGHAVSVPAREADKESSGQVSSHLQSNAAAPAADTGAPLQHDRPEPEVVEVRMEPPPVVVAEKPVAALSGRVGKIAVADPAEAKISAAPAKPTPPITAVAVSAQPPAPAPQLAVSGIVFQPAREARLAIVNDLPVMEGTLIEGAEVVEILVDRVRFVREGNSFEVEMVRGR